MSQMQTYDSVGVNGRKSKFELFFSTVLRENERKSNLNLFFLLFLEKRWRKKIVLFSRKTAKNINLNLFFLSFTPAPF